MLTFQSKVLPPLIGAFASLIILVAISWSISFYFTQRVYEVLDHNALNSEKMHLITMLIETGRLRTRLTGQMLVTEDLFDRDEISQKLNIYATQFAQLRSQLYSTHLTDEEQVILDKQNGIVK